MTCGLAGQAELEFPHSGISIGLYEVSTRSQRGKYSYAKIKIKREDGDRIAQEVEVQEPVLLKFGGHIQNRYVYQSESLRLANDKAWLHLYDARKILNQGLVSQQFDEVTLKDVVNYIVDERQDPYGVITGVNFPDDSASDTTREEPSSTEQLSPGTSGVLKYANLGISFVGAVVKNVALSIVDSGGFDFDDISPNEALEQVETEFNVEAWVDTTGVLYIGKRESKPRNTHAIQSDLSKSPYVISDYNITEGVTPISQVHLTGTRQMKETGIGIYEQFYPIAQANIPGQDGGVYAPDEPQRLRTPEALERAAERKLIQLYSQERNGSIIFNGFASDNPEILVTMGVGDTMAVADTIGGYCSKTVKGGLFVVEEVQHQINTRNGWKVTVEVGEIPPDVQSSSVWYNPNNDEEYKSLEQYQNEN